MKNNIFIIIGIFFNSSAFAITESFTYDNEGRLHTTNGPRSDVSDITTFAYNSMGQVSSITNALGHLNTYNQYDLKGKLLSSTDSNGITTEFTYHSRGWMLTSTLKHPTDSLLDAITVYEYDAAGQLIEVILPNNVKIKFEYNSAHLLTAVENDLGERIEYTLDAAGNRISQVIKSANGNISFSLARVFDELNRVIGIFGNNGQHDSHQYDPNGNETSTTNALIHTFQKQYDSFDRITSVIDPNLGSMSYTYSAQGKIKTVTDPRGHTTVYDYDGLDNLLSITSPVTGTTTFSYDDAGNNLGFINAHGIAVDYTYDALNRLVSVQYPASPIENVSYTYDSTINGNYGIGKLTRINSNNMTTDYRYNYQGLVVEKLVQIDNRNYVTHYDYDLGGNLKKIIYPSGREIHYDFDTVGRIISISTKESSTASSITLINNALYLPFGSVKSFNYGNGLNHNLNYDQDYRITSIDVGGIISRDYGYNSVNSITGIVDNISSNKSQIFGYDSLNRLTNAEGIYGSLDYSYDAAGNRLSETRNGLTDTYFYSSTNNQLNYIDRASGNRSFTYDSVGNPLQRTTENNTSQTYTFNNANRLSSVSENGSLVASYSYNPLGQRTIKLLANGHQEIYHYDELGKLIAVTDNEGNTVREYIYWDNQQIALITNSQPIAPNPIKIDESGVTFTGAHVIASNQTGYTNSGFIDYVGEGRANWNVLIDNGGTYLIKIRYAVAAGYRPLTLLMNNTSVKVADFPPTGSFNTWDVTEILVNLDAGHQTLSLETRGSSGPNIDYVELIQVTTGTPSQLDESNSSFQGNHVIATNYSGYTGTGFIDVTGEGSISWQFNTTQTTNYTLAVRYALGAGSRPMALELDGQIIDILGFVPTTNFSTWNEMRTSFSATAGPHQLRLVTLGASGPNIDALTLLSLNEPTEAGLYYIHNNHLNSPQVVTDESQQVVWMGDFEPFGKLSPNQNEIEIFSRFPGQYVDLESGLYYNYFRDYDPSIGRYIESDPIGLAGGINTYAYATGNPLRFFDFYGLQNCYYSTDEYGNSVKICKGPEDPRPNFCPDGSCAVYPPQTNTPGNTWHGEGPFGPVCGPSGNPVAASWIPDGPMTKACQKHDECYATCGKSKGECDDALVREGSLGYGFAVYIGGQSAYDEAQKKCNKECNK